MYDKLGVSTSALVVRLPRCYGRSHSRYLGNRNRRLESDSAEINQNGSTRSAWHVRRSLWSRNGRIAGRGLFIGAVAWLLLLVSSHPPPDAVATVLRPAAWIGIAGLAGIIGSLTDSWIGATWQQMYRCGTCGREIEQARHCEMPAMRIRGRSGWNNDAVNVTGSLAGGVSAVLLALVLSLS